MVIVLILRWWTTRRCSTLRSLPRSAFGSSRRSSTETFQSSTWWAHSQLSTIFHNYHQFIHNYHHFIHPQSSSTDTLQSSRVYVVSRTFTIIFMKRQCLRQFTIIFMRRQCLQCYEGAFWQHISSLQLPCQPLLHRTNSVVQVFAVIFDFRRE